MKRGIQSLMMLVFTVLSVSIVLILGILFFWRYVLSTKNAMVQNAKTVMEQAGENLEDYLISMRHISDTATYDIISENELTDPEVERELYLLYEANSENIRSIALYDRYGSLLVAEPVARQKEDPDVTKQQWFIDALNEMENYHFSVPHIQNLFIDDTKGYHWVMSLSRTVDITEGETPQMGVLLVDMNYSGIEHMLEQINTARNGQYYFLCDQQGQIIYHPAQMQIMGKVRTEDTEEVAGYKDGIYDMKYDGKRSSVVVRTISYTGWKLIGIIPNKSLYQGTVGNIWMILLFLTLTIMTAFLINRFASIYISTPILKLNESVKRYETGSKTEVYIGGPPEIRHLGASIEKSYEEIDRLMNRIVEEEKERRKSEMDALQSQINPHFLYNTLDSITWMIEGEKNEEASYMVTQLARLLRISLSKGRTVIPLGDEILHAISYMNIQKVRYKESFSVSFDVPKELENYCIVKLVIQPLLENAIYYGVEGLDGDGEITVSVRQDGDKIEIEVADNGIGMPEELAANVLTDSERVHKKGSGVGLRNVDTRIRLMFGEPYGLRVWSEPDEGSRITIVIPMIPYSEANRKMLEEGDSHANRT